MIIRPEQIRRQLNLVVRKRSRTCPPLPGIPVKHTLPAAVLIPLVLDHNTWKLLFIKRTRHKHDRHSGQIAFPGGRADLDDPSLQVTALRETQEEIGVDQADVEILGKSCSITTVTDYEISPYVGLLPWPYQLTLSKEEVEKTLLIPINWLADPVNHRQEYWESPAVPGFEIPVYFFSEFEGEVLWGATAQIVVDFLELIQNTTGEQTD
jgi:8-oxo-dGTP pyrophosphatase MutT (NUDIX family)